MEVEEITAKEALDYYPLMKTSDIEVRISLFGLKGNVSEYMCYRSSCMFIDLWMHLFVYM